MSTDENMKLFHVAYTFDFGLACPLIFMIFVFSSVVAAVAVSTSAVVMPSTAFVLSIVNVLIGDMSLAFFPFSSVPTINIWYVPSVRPSDIVVANFPLASTSVSITATGLLFASKIFIRTFVFGVDVPFKSVLDVLNIDPSFMFVGFVFFGLP